MVEVTPRDIASFVTAMFREKPGESFQIGLHSGLLFQLIEKAVELSGASLLTSDGVEIIPTVTAKVKGLEEVWYDIDGDFVFEGVPSNEEYLRVVGFTDKFFKYFK